MTKSDTIRVLAICVFRHNGRILVSEGYDAVKDEWFYRPLGGAVRFGEKAADALVREIREELDQEVEHVRLMGVLENVFVFEGAAGPRDPLHLRRPIRGQDDVWSGGHGGIRA